MMTFPTEWKVIKLYKIHVPNHQPAITLSMNKAVFGWDTLSGRYNLPRFLVNGG